MIKESKDKREKSGNAIIKMEPSGSQAILPEATVKEEPGTEAHLNGVEEGGGSVPTTSSGIIGSTNAGTMAGGRMHSNSDSCLMGDSLQEITKLEDSNSLDKPPSCSVVKTELNGTTSHEFTGERCEGIPMSNISLASSSVPPANGIQPLPSNVINKQPGTMEAQYMQQQSQIFVFSTSLANKSAEAVLLGQFPSIIAYHCAQPGTKKYLEKHPLKMNQFNRQNPAQWLNNLAQAQMKQKMAPSSPGGFQGPPPVPAPPSMLPEGPAPGQGPNQGQGPPDMWTQNNNMMNQQMQQTLNSTPPGPNCPGNTPIQGVKVPDENLTPQQRQHREEQLARLRNMQQMLFPEHQSPGGGPPLEPPPNGDPMIAQQKSMMMSNQITPTSVAAQIEWQKLQQQFYEERKKKGGGTPRVQGPPPPYHQTPRSASVPTAMPSPNPGSPNNPTSNLSLPSPRAASGLNSPAEPNRQSFPGRLGGPGPSPSSVDSPSRPPNASSPGTPVSTHLSPSATRKDLSQNSSDFSSTGSNQQPPVDGMFCRTLQSLAQQKQLQQPHQTAKEPNLMPVPSPQQIQYLNTFEGQELTIQKQPNTSLKDTNIRSPTLPTAAVEGSGGPGTPLTPTSYPPPGSDQSRFPIPSPHTPTPAPSDGGKRGFQSPRMEKPGNEPPYLTTSPDAIHPLMNPGFGGPHFLDNPPAAPSADVSPTGPAQFPGGPGMQRTENVPLNPNGLACNGKSTHFDPISSMAQMSQQLTNSVASPGSQHGGGMMPGYNAPGMGMMSDVEGCQEGPPNFMPLQSVPQSHAYSPGPGLNPCSVAPTQPNQPPLHTNCSSPKPGNMMMGLRGAPPYAGGQRMMGRPPGPGPIPYNGANIQVKASAPNTIQYLPAKPQTGNAGPRGPPSLEFLQRFTNPLSNLDGKVPTQNLQYFPNSNQPNMMQPMNRQPNGLMHGGHMGGMNGPMMGGMNLMSGGMVMGPGGPGMGMAPLRGSLRPGGMMRMQQMGGMYGVPHSPGQPGPDPMFVGPNQNMPAGNFVPGSKGSPMGLGNAPDASQPLPPSMGQTNNFKNSPFIGPTTADPNYAQQFHNFQQQLYATNTRSQMNNQAIGPNQSFFVPK